MGMIPAKGKGPGKEKGKEIVWIFRPFARGTLFYNEACGPFFSKKHKKQPPVRQFLFPGGAPAVSALCRGPARRGPQHKRRSPQNRVLRRFGPFYPFRCGLRRGRQAARFAADAAQMIPTAMAPASVSTSRAYSAKRSSCARTKKLIM